MNIRPLYRLLKILTYAQDEKVTLNSKILPFKGDRFLFTNQAAAREQIIIVFMLVLKLTANVNSDALILRLWRASGSLNHFI